MTKAELIAVLRRQPVPFDAAGVSVHLRPLTAGDRADVAAWQTEHGAERNYRIIFVRSVCDEAGVRTFADDDAEAVDSFGAEFVSAIVEKALELAGIKGKAPSTATPN